MKKYFLLLCVIISLAFTPKASAQGCSVCTKTAQGLDDKSAKGLNGGILYLAFLPLGIIFSVAGIWWKFNKAR